MSNIMNHKEDSIQSKEREIVEKCKAGLESGYKDFYQLYASGIYNLSCRMLKNHTLAEDAVQEIFIKAYRGLVNFQYQSKVGTWLYRIAVNHCHDMLRNLARHKEVSAFSSTEDEEGQSFIDLIPDERPDPSREQEIKEIRQMVIDAINRLPLEFRETIYLKEIEDLSYEEIGDIVGCRIGTVKSRIFRARELLQKELKGLYQDIKGGKSL